MTLHRSNKPALWLLAAALTILAVTILATSAMTAPAPAHAQAGSGAIPSITLESNEPGKLGITWETPDPTPTDYRLSWAHSSPGFLSYKNPNEAQRANLYPDGGVNTLTLDDLTPGQTYKVQLRACYYNADRSVREWSGPWTSTATQRVKDNPPAAPSGLTLSFVEHNTLTLTLNDPQDRNITGYRIQRGTDANSLHTIEPNTGGPSANYTDSTVVAETTYHYAVQAMSQDGNGARSITSGTTPAEPQSDETSIVQAAPAQQTTNDATLSGLTVSPRNIIGFTADRTTYEVGVASTVTQATITATKSDSGADVAYSGTDADNAADGHQVDLSAGRNEVTVTVTAQDTTTIKTYRVRVNRGVTDDYGWKAALDLDGLKAARNNDPYGIWSDGTTMWVADFDDNKIYAYNTDGTGDSAKDFDTLSAAGNNSPYGIWSDGMTMWVADIADDKLYAYRMSDQSRDSGQDFDTLDAAGNTFPGGIWSDGTTMWVADITDDKLYAYRLSDTVRDSGKDFGTLSAAGNREPFGIWSDDTTIWVVDSADDKIYAYNTDGTRDSGKDFGTLDAAGNNTPYGIWSDGTTMWVADFDDDKVYSYNMPPSADDATLSALTVSPRNIIGFTADRTTYEVGVASTVTQATIAATANGPGAMVSYSGTDADNAADGHQVDLSAGRNEVTVTVTAEDTTTIKTYRVRVNRGVTDDYGWKAALDLGRPEGRPQQ